MNIRYPIYEGVYRILTIVDKAGILYEWNDSDCLATALETLLTDKVLLRQCRENALLLSSSRYNDWVLGERLSNMYQCLI